MRIIIKKTIKMILFILLASFPFIYITELIGFETFLDSFENSNYYICVQDKDNIFQSNTNGDYLIIQKSSHPSFEIKESDIIVYNDYDDGVYYSRINHVGSIASVKRYYIEGNNKEKIDSYIFENQILGKIVEIIDDNILNSISIKIWETSIHNLNLRKNS